MRDLKATHINVHYRIILELLLNWVIMLLKQTKMFAEGAGDHGTVDC